MTDPYRQPSPPPEVHEDLPPSLQWLAKTVPQEARGHILEAIAEQYGIARIRDSGRTETDQELKARILKLLNANLGR